MDKETVRHNARKTRSKLSASYQQQASEDIVQQLIEVAKDKVSIHSFEPMLGKNEVDIRKFNEWVRAQSDKTLHVQDLSGNFPDSEFDLLVVPGLAFDKEGNRIGYGGGHYDRFLVRQLPAQTVGVCFIEQLVDQIPSEAHDVQLSEVISN